MSMLVFDIETIPDIKAGKRLLQLEHLSDEQAAEAILNLRREKSGHEFLPLHQHQIVAISIVFKNNEDVQIWSLGDENASEKELISRFFTGLSKHTPTLVSWNGTGFDLPVLHYRALYHSIQAPDYWENGDNKQDFKWNNYINRYHHRHLDLMDILANYQPRAFAPLDEIACMLGLPGKMGMSGASVWKYHQQGRLKEIRDYCETDVLNTYCVYLRFELMRGVLSKNEHDKAIAELKNHLINQNKSHFDEFLSKWNEND